MGFSGALAGLGKGLQDYSAILGERAKMDWQSQRDELMATRQTELENLRAQHQQAANKQLAGLQQDNYIAQANFIPTPEAQQNKLDLFSGQTKITTAAQKELDAQRAAEAMTLAKTQGGITASNQAAYLDSLYENQIGLQQSQADINKQSLSDQRDIFNKTIKDLPKDEQDKLKIINENPHLAPLLTPGGMQFNPEIWKTASEQVEAANPKASPQEKFTALLKTYNEAQISIFGRLKKTGDMQTGVPIQQQSTPPYQLPHSPLQGGILSQSPAFQKQVQQQPVNSGINETPFGNVDYSAPSSYPGQGIVERLKADRQRQLQLQAQGNQ